MYEDDEATCGVCGLPLDLADPKVGAYRGELVHRSCAPADHWKRQEREYEGYQRGQAIRAAITAGALVIIGIGLVILAGWSAWVALGALAVGAVLHVRLNRHWWRRIVLTRMFGGPRGGRR